MLKTVSKDLGDLTYTTTQFPAMRSVQLLTRLAKVAGPVLAALAGAQPTDDISVHAPKLAGALAGLEPVEASSLVADVLMCTAVAVPDAAGGRRIEFTSATNIDLVFSGRLGDLFKILMWVIEVNYGDFSVGSAPQPTPATTLPASA